MKFFKFLPRFLRDNIKNDGLRHLLCPRIYKLEHFGEILNR